MAKYLTDLIKVEEMGVAVGGSRSAAEEYVSISWGDEFELGLDVDGGFEVVDETGEVVGYIFLVPKEVSAL